MPEGPSIVILKEAAKQFTGQKVIAVSGSSKLDVSRLKDQVVSDFKSWGKHFLICFENFTIKIHLLMFGTYRINERKDIVPRLSLTFDNGELNFYTCSIKFLEGNINIHYDWSADVMNKDWDSKSAKKKLKAVLKQLICDSVLDQNIFSGVGNIIKNEVLYRAHVHPESQTGKIPQTILNKIIKECSNYSFQFLEWKKNDELKDHWLAHTKRTCLRCNLPLIKKQTGVKKRRSFFCPNCQKLYL